MPESPAAPRKKLSITSKILIWMLVGLVVGSVINATATEVTLVQDLLVNGVFHVGGTMFINSLKMLVVPLVTFSLLCGVLGVGDVQALGRVGVKALILYLGTTALAISMSLGLATVFSPGQGFDRQSTQLGEVVAKEAPPLTEIIIALLPSNPVTAFANGEMLQIISFTLLFGVCMLMAGDSGKKLGSLAEAGNEVMMKLVSLVMSLAPYGVFCLMAKTFSQQGPALIKPMAGYFFLVILALLIHGLVVLPLLLKLFTGLNPLTFLRKFRAVQVFAFSTASSNATIPVSLRTAEERLGVNKSTAAFTIPLGATINMDGTAIMQGIATVFVANVYNIDLGLTQYMTIIGMAVLASIGTAGVPGVGLIMLAMVFNQVNLPVEGIGLIMGVDRLLDMVRTAVNVTGDAVVTCITAKGEKKLDFAVYNDPQAGVVE